MKKFKLDNRTKITPGFTTPDNYFEDFQYNITSKLKNEPKVFSLSKSWIMAAAAILLMALGITLINKMNTVPTTIDAISLENYIATHTTISEDDLVNLLDEQDIENITIHNNLEDKAIEETLLQNTNLEHYIIN